MLIILIFLLLSIIIIRSNITVCTIYQEDQYIYVIRISYCLDKDKVLNSQLMTKMIVPLKDHFLYFAYGSNLLKRRIKINNPTAEFLGTGRLDNYILDFMKYSDHWRGTSATIVPKENSVVWGAIWRLHDRDLPALDRQEGVQDNWYFPKVVDIITTEGETVQCRTYQQTINPPAREENDEIPMERRPSITYLNVILKGAVECQLPKDYIEKLNKLQHNGQEASPKMIAKLDL